MHRQLLGGASNLEHNLRFVNTPDVRLQISDLTRQISRYQWALTYSCDGTGVDFYSYFLPLFLPLFYRYFLPLFLPLIFTGNITVIFYSYFYW